MREVFDRYGPAMAIIVVLALLVVLAPAGGGADQALNATGGSDFDGTGVIATDGSSTGFGGTSTGGATGTVAGSDGFGGPGTSGGTGGTAGTASGAGGGTTGGGAATSGGSPAGGGGTAASPGAPGGVAAGGASLDGVACREDGNISSFSYYAPFCTPVFSGDNGDATHKGVSADEIRLVYYFPNASAATNATLQAIGADDPRPQTMDVAKALTRYFNIHYETYGREVKVTFFESTAATDDEAALRADAVKIDNDLQPFAVIGAGDVTATELAARGIMCVCTATEASGFYQQNAPHVFAIFPELEEHYQQMAEYQGKRLAGKPARYAGNLPAGIQSATRKFGLIYQEGTGNQIDPRAKEGVAYYEQELARYGIKLAAKVAYTVDVAQGQSVAANLIAQMSNAGVTTIACVCDPLTPIFFTKAATQQQYYPEWFMTGTQLTDTTFFGRTYDQAQWSHAFGVSPLPVPATNISDTAPFQEYFHGKGSGNPGDEGTQILVREPAFSLLFSGIHQAGPDLSPATFAKALHDAPAKGGPVGTVLVKATPESYSVIKDFVEVYWDPTGSGRDEVGNDGVGRMLKSDGARRYQAGQWPQGDPKVFAQGANPVYSVDGKTFFDHAADGHKHAAEERCRSCR